MVSCRSSSKPLRRRLPSLLHPIFRRAPVEWTAGLRNPASCDPVWERGDQVFGERTRATTGSDYFPNDDFFPGIGNLFIDEMGDNGDDSGSAPATTYVFQSFLFEILLQFLFIVLGVGLISTATILVDHMISLILVVPVMNYSLFSWIKSYAKLLISSTIQKPDSRQFTPTGFHY